MKKFFYRHSLILFLAVLFGRGIVGMLAVAGIQLINPALTIQKDLGWVIMIIYATFVIAAVKWVKIDKEIGLTMPDSSKDWYVWIPTLIIPGTLIYYLGFNYAWGFLPFLLIAAVGVAINEEILFRGILLKAILPFGTAIAIVVPSLLFGVAHLGNILAGGDVTYGLFQFGWTFFAGMSLTVMRLANNSLLPCIAFHFILDAIEYMATGEFGIHSGSYPLKWLTIFLLLNVAFFMYSLYIYKKKKVHSHKLNLQLAPTA